LLYIEGAAVVSQTRKNIDDQKTNAQMDRYGLDVSAGAELRLKNIGISLGPYAEMGIMRGQAPFGSGLSDPFVTTNTYVGAGAQLGLDFLMKGKKIDFTAGLRARAGYRSIGVSSIYFNNNIGHSVGGSAFGAGLRFSIAPGTITDDTESEESTEGAETAVEEGGQPVEGAPVEGAAPAGGEALPVEGATPAPGVTPVPGAVPVPPGGRTPVPPRVPDVPGVVLPPEVPGAVPVAPLPPVPASQFSGRLNKVTSDPEPTINDLGGNTFDFDRTIVGYVTIRNINEAVKILLGQNKPAFDRIIASGNGNSDSKLSGDILTYSVRGEFKGVDVGTVYYRIQGRRSDPSPGTVLVSWGNISGGQNSFTKNEGSWKLEEQKAANGASYDPPVYKLTWHAHTVAHIPNFPFVDEGKNLKESSTELTRKSVERAITELSQVL